MILLHLHLHLHLHASVNLELLGGYGLEWFARCSLSAHYSRCQGRVLEPDSASAQWMHSLRLIDIRAINAQDRLSR